MKKICFLRKSNGLQTITVYLDFDDEFPQLEFRWITDEGVASLEKWDTGLDEISYSEYKAMVNKAIEENEPQPCSWDDYATMLEFLDYERLVFHTDWLKLCANIAGKKED